MHGMVIWKLMHQNQKYVFICLQDGKSLNIHVSDMELKPHKTCKWPINLKC